MLARMAALELALAEQQGSDAQRRALTQELDVLGARVRAATGELEQDHAVMTEVASALAALRTRLAPAAAAATLPPRAARAVSRRRLLLTFGLLAALLGVLVVLLTRKGPPRDKASIPLSERPTLDERPPLKCRIDSQPEGAELVLRGVTMARTPVTLVLGRHSGLDGYLLRHPGYRDVDLGGMASARDAVAGDALGLLCRIRVELEAEPDDGVLPPVFE
ncbi:MAG: hypothetical protein IT370_15235 [Deltaproteobacteria bacterium]|nr:hypothetical protein [Deltaproteobacteria bacterium]